jgi:DNA-directed RNA polymerase specialized sigma24 family protein
VLTGNPDLAQDIVQDVLIRVLARWRQIETYDHPDHYVRKAIVNAYVSWRRQWSVRNLVPFGSPPERAAPESNESEPSAELWQRLATLPGDSARSSCCVFTRDSATARLPICSGARK